MTVKLHLYKLEGQSFGKGNITLHYGTVKILLDSIKFKVQSTFRDFSNDRRLCHLYLYMNQSLNSEKAGGGVEIESKTETKYYLRWH